jgi:hypothetical protein
LERRLVQINNVDNTKLKNIGHNTSFIENFIMEIESYGYIADINTLCLGIELIPYYRVIVKKCTQECLSEGYITPVYDSIYNALANALDIIIHRNNIKRNKKEDN